MINTIQLSHAALNQDLTVVHALSSITSEQADTIALIVCASGQAWDVQAIDDYDGYRSILIEPTISSDEQKALFISGTVQRLEPFEAQDDDLKASGLRWLSVMILPEIAWTGCVWAKLAKVPAAQRLECQRRDCRS